MAPISCDRKTSLEDYGVNLDAVYARTGAFGRVGKSKDPALWDQFSAEEIHNQLRCTHSESHWLVSDCYNEFILLIVRNWIKRSLPIMILGEMWDL